MNCVRELTLDDIDLGDSEIDSDCSDDSQICASSYQNEENDIENDSSQSSRTKPNENVLSFENNEDLITKLWSHARIQNILMSIGIVQAILVTFFCTLYMLQDNSPHLLLTEYVNHEFARKYFLSVAESGEVFVKQAYVSSIMANKLFSVHYSEPSKALLYLYEYKRKIHAIHRKSNKYDKFDMNCLYEEGIVLKTTYLMIQ